MCDLLTTRVPARAALALAMCAAAASGGETSPGSGMDTPECSDRWLEHAFTGPAPRHPFSFTYGGRASAELMAAWQKGAERTKIDGARTQHTFTWKDPAGGLIVRCVMVEFAGFPTLEWTLYFKNEGAEKTPLLATIAPLDIVLRRDATGEFLLHRTVGDGGRDIYAPDPIALPPGSARRFAPEGGRPSSGEFPYFNIEHSGGGTIIAIGWPGQWAASFTRDGADGLHVTAGQELTSFALLPGEELRSPRIVLQCWKGDRAHSQNVWRRWMRAHNMPRPGGAEVAPQMNVCNANQFGYFGTTEDNQRVWIQRYREEGIAFDYWWLDLSWFALDPHTYVYNALYDPDPVRFPRGLKPLGEDLRKDGARLIAWFEPEHYYPGPGNWICEHHPEWLLKAPPGREDEINQGMPLRDRRILNLGDPDALRWVTDNIDRVIREQGIDYYRHDFNIEPLIFWRAGDAPDRQGVTEIKYVMGFLAFYDELLRRHPGMLIDNCASGGRRNDVETLRRSVPLLRSDTWGEPVSQQCQTYGLASWIPFWGTGIVHSDPKDVAYVFRSQMGPSYTSCWDLTPKADYGIHRKLLVEWRSVRDDIYRGDYYPLTAYGAGGDVWMAWQFHSSEHDRGVVQAFRRHLCESPSAVLRLRGLDASARYEVRDLDAGTAATSSGEDLMATGLRVEIADRPGSALHAYSKVD